MSEWITIREAKEIGILPEEYHECIAETCRTEIGGCGEDLYTTRNLKTQKCMNPRCILKQTGRMVQMLNNFGIIGIGPKFARNFMVNNGFVSHINILVATKEQMYATGRFADSARLYKRIQEVLAQRYTYADIISRMGFPGLGVTAKDIFRDFYNLEVMEAFLSLTNRTRFDYLMSLNGISFKKATEIEKTMDTFRVELVQIANIFKLLVPGKKHIKLVMTGDIVYYCMTKPNYIAYLNRVFEGYISFEDAKQSVKSADYVVCANKYMNHRVSLPDGDYVENVEEYDFRTEEISPYMTGKHKAALVRCKQTNQDCIKTPLELVLYFQKVVEEGLT